MKIWSDNGFCPFPKDLSCWSQLFLSKVLMATFLLMPWTTLADTMAAQITLPVVSVSLFSSGVGFFQHAGDIDGPNQIILPFKEEEINDVLKSLVLNAPESEPAGFAVFPSQQPLDRLLKGFIVDLSHNPTLADILTQLRGNPVQITYQGKEILGRILGMEQRPLAFAADPDKTMLSWTINLATSEGLRTFPLLDVEKLLLTKGETQGDLIKALDALEQAGGHERKNLQVSFPGTGKRRVSLGYIVENAVWKSGYRLLLPQGDSSASQAPLRGWAIVENQTDNDWNGIRLSLISGLPISFVQELYAPRYIDRPRVTADGDAVIQPVRHEDGLPMPKNNDPRLTEEGIEPAVMAKAAPLGLDRDASDQQSTDVHTTSEGSSLPKPWMAAVEANLDGVSVRFDVEGVDLPRRRGAMIPFFTRSVPIERISLFNIRNHATHPLQGVFLENNSDQHLPSGPVTLFDGERYAGDAILSNLPPGQKGLLTHALDQEIHVMVIPKLMSGRLTSGRISKGVLQLTRRNISRHEYLLNNTAKKSKTLVIEHPRTTPWNLVKPEKPFEITTRSYRFRLNLEPGEEERILVVEEILRTQKIQLAGNLSSVIFSYASEEGFSDQLKNALEQASRLQGRVEELTRKLNHLTRNVRNDSEEQARVRTNLASVPNDTSFYKRMMEKMDTLENALERKEIQAAKIRAEREAALSHLETFIGTLEM
ncbi:MAG: hypothetical protein HQL89_18580 [Magnetococcales bacterium]|nr:hypothetical protein [Magnetococcales bacterium]